MRQDIRPGATQARKDNWSSRVEAKFRLVTNKLVKLRAQIRLPTFSFQEAKQTWQGFFRRPDNPPAKPKPHLVQTPPRRTQQQRQIPPRQPTPQSTITAEKILIYLFVGLTILCVTLILIMLKQMNDIKSTIAVWQKEIAATNARLSQVEKAQQDHLRQQIHAAPKEPARHAPLALVQSDFDIVRQFIKVPPQAPGKSPTVHLGDQVPDATSIPVPEALTDKLPVLRGARFFLDQDGSIVLIGKGSNQADAIVSPQY